MKGMDGRSEDSLPVREEIVVSWFRSARSGVRFDQFQVPFDGDIDRQGRLAWASGPILHALADDLADSRNAVVLTDARSHVLARHVRDEALQRCLDRIQLSPGFRYGEHEAGTNAIGTALTVGRPFVVEGGEHFAEVLATIACAAAPVIDPRTGDPLGTIDLSCRAEHANPLMLPLAKHAAWEIEQRLVGDLSSADRTLREHFVNARRRTRDGLVSVSKATLLGNARATSALEPGDHELLWDWICRAVASHQTFPADLPLAAGTWVAKSLEPVREGGIFVGATLRLLLPSSRLGGGRSRFGWTSLTPTELSIARLVAEGLTNRQVAANLYLSPHTVGFHLRQVFRKLEISSRVELARLV
jgi:DNA-binding CsgD family transcriptional regulator